MSTDAKIPIPESPIRPQKVAVAKRLILDPKYPRRRVLMVAGTLAALDALKIPELVNEPSLLRDVPGSPDEGFPGAPSSRACPGCGDKIPAENSVCFHCEM